MISCDVDRVIVIGSSKAISASKIRKITAIKKNRKENGSRALLHLTVYHVLHTHRMGA
jgi:hypothetical protein